MELYKKAIPLWRGNRLFLIGAEWNHYMDVLPQYGHVQVKILEQLSEEIFDNGNQDKSKILYVNEFLPQNESLERYHNGILCYDEVMTLTFMFSHVIHPGVKNPDKRFFKIDGYFRIEGVVGIWNKVFTAARYALAKGYLPFFEIDSSDDSMYSDYKGDDIWNKFFLQPGGYDLQEVHQSQSLTLSPNMNALTILRHIMDQVSEGFELSWPRGIFNDHLKRYIEQRRKRYLPHPERTLGVLIRGTDFIHNPLPNHAKQADVSKVAEKIKEVEDEWDFDFIYLATEDEDICRRMSELFGPRIHFTDQERYKVRPGHLLAELHNERRKGEGFRLGAEYQCSIHLLSQCKCMVASGICGGTVEALKENKGKYEHVYIFGMNS